MSPALRLQERMMVEEWHTFHTKNLEQDAVLLLFDMIYESLAVFKKQYWLGVIAMQVHTLSARAAWLLLRTHQHTSCEVACAFVPRHPIPHVSRLQNPFDFLSISDIIWQTQPDIIIETGKESGTTSLLIAGRQRVSSTSLSWVLLLQSCPWMRAAERSGATAAQALLMGALLSCGPAYFTSWASTTQRWSLWTCSHPAGIRQRSTGKAETFSESQLMTTSCVHWSSSGGGGRHWQFHGNVGVIVYALLCRGGKPRLNATDSPLWSKHVTFIKVSMLSANGRQLRNGGSSHSNPDSVTKCCTCFNACRGAAWMTVH
jgi:hypothetical protein